MWDGAEQAMYSPDNYRSHDGFEMHMNTMGWNISRAHYEKWKQNIGKSFKAPQVRRAPKSLYNERTRKMEPNFNGGKIRLVSTAVYGRTIFWRSTK